MNERFTVKRIQEIARGVAGFFDRELVKSIPDLERRVGNEFPGLKEQEFISVTMNPSNFGTRAYTVSYVVQGSGIPVEVKINPHLKYSALIAKAEHLLFGFTQFMTDPNENKMQHRRLSTLDIGEISDALRSLRPYAQG
jgi:hypothetical protein